MSQHGLYIHDETTAVDVLDFVVRRTANPTFLAGGEVVVFNYNNAELEPEPLERWAETAEEGVYIYPYSIPSLWVFMERVLPKGIRDGRILAFRQGEEEYVAYTNWRRRLTDPDESFDDSEAVRRRRNELEHLVGVLDHV